MLSNNESNPIGLLAIGFLLGTFSSRGEFEEYYELFCRTVNSFVPIYTALTVLYVIFTACHFGWKTFFSPERTLDVSKTISFKKPDIDKKEDEAVPPKDTTPEETIKTALPVTPNASNGKKEEKQPPAAGTTVSEKDEEVESQPIDLTGSYKLVKNDNFKEFLASQGVNYVLRTAADKAVTVHHVTHKGNSLRIQVSGIINSATTYIIGGPAVETRIQDKVFQDVPTYLEDGTGVMITKTSKSLNYNITVVRKLSPDKKFLYITSTATHTDGKKVVAVQTYERI